jgi:acyl-CoA thioesterase-1
MWNFASQRRTCRQALAITALAAVSFGPIASRADAPTACPATAANTFSENGAEAVLTERSDKRPLRILAIGSSSTQGIGASSPGAAYPAQLETRLEKDWGIAADVVNAGVGGETSDTTLKRLLAALAEDSPDLIVWQVGTNDAVVGLDPAAFRANLAAGVAAAQAHRVPVVLVDPQFYFGIRNLARFQQYVNIIADVGAARRVPVFSRFAMMRAWAKSSAATLTAALSPDGFHMDDRGYACFADALADDLVRQEEAAEPAEKL